MKSNKIKLYIKVVSLAIVVVVFVVFFDDLFGLARNKTFAGNLWGTSFVLLKLEKGGKLGRYNWSYDGEEISDKITLSDDDIIDIKKMFREMHWTRDRVAMCHEPGFVLKSSFCGIPLENISICFHCDDIEYGGSYIRFQLDFFSKSGIPLKNRLIEISGRK